MKNISKILFVVHRYSPWPGGSEIYVQNMAEELFKRGHSVAVLTDCEPRKEWNDFSSNPQEHIYSYNNVVITQDFNVLSEHWDLIIVHGGDVYAQNVVHFNAKNITSPVVYMLIKPSESEICMNGLMNHKYLAYSTKVDLAHIEKHSLLEKARRVRHGVKVEDSMGISGFKKRYSIKQETPIFVSAGGFWPNKNMGPLAKAFNETKLPNLKDAKLILFGYDNRYGIAPEETHRVFVIHGAHKQTVMDAIKESHGYIQNSLEEGFGLVLLEAMLNRVPWYAKDAPGGASDMYKHGIIYKNEQYLMDALNDRLYSYDHLLHMEDAYNYTMQEHTIKATCDDLEDILIEEQTCKG